MLGHSIYLILLCGHKLWVGTRRIRLKIEVAEVASSKECPSLERG